MRSIAVQRPRRPEAAQVRRRGWYVLCVAAIGLLWSALSIAAVAPVDLDAHGRALVIRLELDRATSLAAANRRAEARERELLEEQAGQDRALRRKLRLAEDALREARQRGTAAERAAQSELARLTDEVAVTRQALDRLTAERALLVADMAQRDHAFRIELEEYRRQVLAIATSPSPGRRAALERFADGDRKGAMAMLDRLDQIAAEARRRAAVRIADLESAKEVRERATLALAQKDLGEADTTDSLARWREAAGLDPDDHWTWIMLSRLHMEEGAVPAAREAAQQALRTAANDRERSSAANALGDVEIIAGDLAVASQQYASALAIDRRSVDQATSDPMARRNLASSLLRAGDAQSAAGRSDTARTHYLEAVQLLGAIATAPGADRSVIRDVAVASGKLADVLIGMGDVALAQPLVDHATAAARTQLQNAPGSADAMHDLAAALERSAATLAASGNVAAARSHFAESRALTRRVAAANPASGAAARAVVVSLTRSADLEMHAGDLARARPLREEALSVATSLAAVRPTEGRGARDLLLTLVGVAEVRAASGDAEAAVQALQRARDLAGDLARRNPASAEARNDLAVVLDRLGDVFMLRSEMPAAREAYEHGLRLSRALAEGNPGAVQRRRDVAVGLNKLGDTEMMAGAPDAAARRFAESLGIVRSLAGRQPESVQFRRDLSVGLIRLGDALLRKGVADEASPHYMEAYAIRKALASATPDSGSAQRDLATAMIRLAQMPGSGVGWREAGDVLRAMHERGQLLPQDRKLLDMVEQAAAGAR